MSSTSSAVQLVQNDASNADGGTVTTGGSSTAPQPEPQQSQFWSIVRSMMFRFAIIYFLSNLFRRPQTPTQMAGSSKIYKPSHNLFENGTIMDLYFYVSKNEFEPEFQNPNELFWLEKSVIYGDWYGGPSGDGLYSHSSEITASTAVQNNASIWLHVYIVKSGFSPYPLFDGEKVYSPVYTLHQKKQLNKYKKKKVKTTHNLIAGPETVENEKLQQSKNITAAAAATTNGQNAIGEINSYWHPNLTVNIIVDYTEWFAGAVPQPLDEFIQFEPSTGDYFPIVYLNDYWNLLRDYQPINETTKTLQLNLVFQPLSLMRFQIYSAQAMRHKWSSMFDSKSQVETDDEQDLLKETFLETSPYLLALTVIVSLTHGVFEFLAFKNDVQFWKNRSNLEGLSVRSVFFNVFQSVIVLLYVLDNDTNTLIKFSVGIGLLIELWKIKKVVNIEVKHDEKIFGLLPKVVISDKGSYAESSTKDYDHMAFKYLSWILFPLFVGYAIYSLIYLEHKGFYSFILSLIYGFLLTFGFIMMTPQLFINYKLKSVAHLPWRMLTYKFLNTFIDDIFAFVIKMPTMYRISCFRDDIIFIIFLYQRWIYRIDLKRVNEFGVSGEDLSPNQELASNNNSEVPALANEPHDSSSAKTESKKTQ